MIRLHADTFIWFFRNKVCVVSLQLWVVGGREQTDWGEGMNGCIKKKKKKKEARKIWERERTYRRPICAHAWTTPDISWSALLHGIHDNTVSWEVGMTTTGREKRQQRAEGGEVGKGGGGGVRNRLGEKKKGWKGKMVKNSEMSHWCRKDVSPVLQQYLFCSTQTQCNGLTFRCTGINWRINPLADSCWLLAVVLAIHQPSRSLISQPRRSGSKYTVRGNQGDAAVC